MPQVVIFINRIIADVSYKIGVNNFESIVTITSNRAEKYVKQFNTPEYKNNSLF